MIKDFDGEIILGAIVITEFLIRGRQEGRVRMEAETTVMGLGHKPRNVAPRSWKKQGMDSP